MIPHGHIRNVESTKLMVLRILHFCAALSSKKIRHFLLVGVVSIAVRLAPLGARFIMIQGSTLVVR